MDTKEIKKRFLELINKLIDRGFSNKAILDILLNADYPTQYIIAFQKIWHERN